MPSYFSASILLPDSWHTVTTERCREKGLIYKKLLAMLAVRWLNVSLRF